jgi:predicted enzyme related to lactoylglutathione lyase
MMPEPLDGVLAAMWRDVAAGELNGVKKRGAAMTTRDRAPLGAPCWTDLWTSDVEGSRKFYSELFGWEAAEPSPEFGGYFMFTRNGEGIAGGMGDMGDMKADNAWKVYLQTDDINSTIDLATKKGATVMSPAMPVADLGVQCVMSDSTGATLGAWQPGTFHGFSVLDERGAPSWFELHTSDFGKAVDFYESVFHWQTTPMGDTDEFRYSVMNEPNGDDQLAGIMDARSFLGGTPSRWFVYWEVDDVVASSETVVSLGGSIVQAAEKTPHGTLATVADPAGAVFKLRTA